MNFGVSYSVLKTSGKKLLLNRKNYLKDGLNPGRIEICAALGSYEPEPILRKSVEIHKFFRSFNASLRLKPIA